MPRCVIIGWKIWSRSHWRKTVRRKARRKLDGLDLNQDLIFSLNLKCKWDYFVKKNMHLTHIFKCVKDSLVTYLPRPCLILSRNYLCASHKNLIFCILVTILRPLLKEKKIPTTSLFIVHPILYWSNPSERIEGKSQIKTILNFQFCLWF